MSGHNIHPSINDGVQSGSEGFSGGTLECNCPSDKVEVTLSGDVAFNHACGCSKCWKPDGALFSVVAVIPSDKLSVTANEDKLEAVDPDAVIVRHACKDCGTHMYGRINDKNHAFYGLDFVHVELSPQDGWSEPQFAAFVSSIIEQGFPADKMGEIRGQIEGVGLPSYDVLSPDLMDLIASNTYKQANS